MIDPHPAHISLHFLFCFVCSFSLGLKKSHGLLSVIILVLFRVFVATFLLKYLVALG